VRFLALALACALPGAAAAEDLKVLSAAAVAPGLVKIAEQYRKDTKNRLRIQYIAPPQLERRLGSGESADILIASPGLMNDQLRRNKIEPEKHVFIGRVGIGIAIRAGQPDLDIATLDRFKQTLLGAESVVYSVGGSGLYLEKLFELLGLGEQLKAKTTRYANVSQVLEHVQSGKGFEIGFATIPEIRMFETKGLKLAGPLPEQIQSSISYSAGVMTEAAAPEVAREFIQYLETPAAKAIFTVAGFD
jgi:molybdate transport system substrate-binding protein